MRILIADDDATTRQALQALLLQWGYEAETVCDGQAACMTPTQWPAMPMP
jgi:CheY-like chemotaxis protein